MSMYVCGKCVEEHQLPTGKQLKEIATWRSEE